MNLIEQARREAEELLGNRQRKTLRECADEIERLRDEIEQAIVDLLSPDIPTFEQANECALKVLQQALDNSEGCSEVSLKSTALREDD